MSFYNASATAASNTTINSISAAGSASANLIDDLIRQLAAQDRQFANDLGGNNTVGGTADAITITPSSGSITAAFKGLLIGFVAAYDNATNTPTANVGGLGAEPIKKAIGGVESTLAVSDIQAGAFCWLLWRPTWDSSNGAWELISTQVDALLKGNNLSDLASTSAARSNLGLGSAGPLSHRNKIINGNFDVWQRGTSLSAFGYLADRWELGVTGSTIVQSRQSFALGQTDVPGNPKYYHRTVVTSVAGSGNYVAQVQKIEGVQTFAGETVTLSFWAKADASKNICVEFSQSFGTGGSPSSLVNVPSPTTIALTTSWQKFTVTTSIPSISGKTLGTNGNDWLGLVFWYEAGSNFNSSTNSLGQQSGTFDIAQVQLEAGSTATPFEHRSYGEELALCQRYYTRIGGENAGDIYNAGYVTSNGFFGQTIAFPVAMRATPTATVVGTWTVSNVAQPTINATSKTTSNIFTLGTVVGQGSYFTSGVSTYLTFSAEL